MKITGTQSHEEIALRRSRADLAYAAITAGILTLETMYIIIDMLYHYGK